MNNILMETEKSKNNLNSKEDTFNIQGDLSCRIDQMDVSHIKMHPTITVSVCGFIEIFMKSNGVCYKSKKLKINQVKNISIIVPPHAKLQSELSDFRIIAISHHGKKTSLKILFCSNTFVIKNKVENPKCSVLVTDFEIMLNNVSFEKIPDMSIEPHEINIVSNIISPEYCIFEETDNCEPERGHIPKKCNCKLICYCGPLHDIEPTGDFESASDIEPAGEIEPISDIEPAGEIEPNSDIEPAGEIEPISDIEPAGEIEPISDVEPAGEIEPISDIEPAGEIEPISDIEPTGEIEPISDIEPAGEIEPISDTEPADYIEPNQDHQPIYDYETQRDLDENDINLLEMDKDLRNVKLKDILRENYPQLQEHLVEADVILVSSGNIGQLIDNLESVHFDRAWIKSESIENFYYDYAGNLMVYEPGDYRASHYVLSDEVGNFSINANGKIIPPLSYYKGAGDDYFIDSAETTISLKETPTALQLQNVTGNAVILSPNKESIAVIAIKKI